MPLLASNRVIEVQNFNEKSTFDRVVRVHDDWDEKGQNDVDEDADEGVQIYLWKQ